jgi:hypothetical protein
MVNSTIAIILGVILGIISIVVLIWASGIGRSNADVIADYKGGKGSKLKFKKLKKIKKH